MARIVHDEFMYVVIDAEETNEDSEPRVVGGGLSGSDAGINNETSQVPESQGKSEESSRDLNPSSPSLEPHLGEPRPSAGPATRTPRRRSSRRGNPFQFTYWQTMQMENLFIETQRPNMRAREELARVLNVPEVDVKMWFINRRAKERKKERQAMLQSLPPCDEKVLIKYTEDSS
ncbi:hypothetical protein STEG23_002918 [Scotinomys teguina]